MQTILLGLLTVAMVANPLRNAFIMPRKTLSELQQVSISAKQYIYIPTARDPTRHTLGYSEAAEGFGGFVKPYTLPSYHSGLGAQKRLPATEMQSTTRARCGRGLRRTLIQIPNLFLMLLEADLVDCFLICRSEVVKR